MARALADETVRRKMVDIKVNVVSEPGVLWGSGCHNYLKPQVRKGKKAKVPMTHNGWAGKWLLERQLVPAMV